MRAFLRDAEGAVSTPRDAVLVETEDGQTLELPRGLSPIEKLAYMATRLRPTTLVVLDIGDEGTKLLEALGISVQIVGGMRRCSCCTVPTGKRETDEAERRA